MLGGFKVEVELLDSGGFFWGGFRVSGFRLGGFGLLSFWAWPRSFVVVPSTNSGLRKGLGSIESADSGRGHVVFVR